MPRYQVDYSDEGRADYQKLAPGPRGDAKAFQRLLANGPDMPQSQQLETDGDDNMWRIRTGRSDWRIIFRLDREHRRITITDIKRRPAAYSQYPRPLHLMRRTSW